MVISCNRFFVMFIRVLNSLEEINENRSNGSDFPFLTRNLDNRTQIIDCEGLESSLQSNKMWN